LPTDAPATCAVAGASNQALPSPEAGEGSDPFGLAGADPDRSGLARLSPPAKSGPWGAGCAYGPLWRRSVPGGCRGGEGDPRSCAPVGVAKARPDHASTSRTPSPGASPKSVPRWCASVAKRGDQQAVHRGRIQNALTSSVLLRVWRGPATGTGAADQTASRSRRPDGSRPQLRVAASTDTATQRGTTA